MNFKFAIPALAVAAAFAAPASAALPVYAPIGTPNATTYSFAAASTGHITLYYLGGITTGYATELTLLVNGVERSAIPAAAVDPKAVGWDATWGSVYDFGAVYAGDELVWKLTHIAPPTVAGTEIYSDPSLNPNPGPGGTKNNIFSAAYGGGDFGVAAGSYTFVAYEDIYGRSDPAPHRPGNLYNDYDYNDFRFAYFVNGNAVPEPATWAMLITGFGLVGFAMRRRKASLSSVAA